MIVLTLYGMLIWLVPLIAVIATGAYAHMRYNMQKLDNAMLTLRETDQIDQPITEPKLQATAIVCGGSAAGTLAAAILSRHYEKVIVIDDEYVKVGKVVRKHVMQWDQIHSFNPLVRVVFEKVWGEEALAKAIKQNGGGYDQYVYQVHYKGRPFKFNGPTDFPRSDTLLLVDRETLENVNRRFLGTVPNVSFIRSKVQDVITKDDKISGVSLANGDVVEGELIVDCTGAAANGLDWMSKHYSLDIVRKFYNPSAKYVTVRLQGDIDDTSHVSWPKDGPQYGAIYSAFQEADEKRGGLVIFRYLDDSTVMGCLALSDVRDMPRSDADVLEWMSRFGVPKHISDLITYLVSEARVQKHPARDSKFGMSDYLAVCDLLPDNFIAVGDSLSKLNPVYGQGHLQIANQLSILDDVLRIVRKGTTSPISKLYFPKASLVSDALQQGNRMNDYGFDGVIPIPGESLSFGADARKFSTAMKYACTVDPAVTAMFFRVVAGYVTAMHLFRPDILLRIWYANLGR